ncbi:fatty-acyl-CoA synthase [Natrinema hispanicum]|uniref:Fatty-acyl-CoA synthase n=1 Tax=Natrinema hispanicum TaxID=392421 RepID=A0A482YBX8_9EURY|nr:long-chain-fatty-acid--CoA ligase [Natrinema hispanicum]RZV06378.1 fatty-acyl-CoA synthase [Natrinema hispanicum]
MDRPLLVPQFLDRARTYFGEEEAIVAANGDRFTYDEFGERADRLSAALQDRGVEKGDRVAVLAPNTHYHLESVYGITQIGAVHTPLNYRLVPSDFEYMLNDCDVTAIIVDHEYADQVEAVRDEVPVETFIASNADEVDGDWEDFDEVLADTEPTYDRPEMDEEDIITINYTSGTTGDPKGVMRNHRGETIHAYSSSVHRDISDDDVYLWTLPMFHVNGWGHVFSITGIGGTHVCTRGVDAADVFETIQEEDVSYFCAAPTVLNMLLDYHETNDPVTTGDNDVRVATAGSAPPESTIRTVEDEFGWELAHVYGATETGPLIATSEVNRFLEDDQARYDIKKRQGIPMLGTEIRVVDDDGNEVPWDDATIGEIVVRGNQIMEGYWENPEETERAFNDRLEGWFHMGDLATVDENGMIAIQDRKKDIIISGGENISSIELEDTLYEHPEVAEVAVIPSPSDQWGETPKAFIVPANGDPTDPGVTAEEIIDFTRENLASYKVVRRVEFVKQLPTTATGKVEKYELREQEWDEEDSLVGQG